MWFECGWLCWRWAHEKGLWGSEIAFHKQNPRTHLDQSSTGTANPTEPPLFTTSHMVHTSLHTLPSLRHTTHYTVVVLIPWITCNLHKPPSKAKAFNDPFPLSPYPLLLQEAWRTVCGSVCADYTGREQGSPTTGLGTRIGLWIVWYWAADYFIL